jgi:DNA-binding CsgD family transcriptional regulator/PAS domain-containing protein
MQPSLSDLLRLTLTAHEAALEPSVWPAFLADYAKVIRADIVVFQRHHLASDRSELLATFGMAQRFTDSYNRHYSRLNIWRDSGRHLYITGRVVIDPEMCSRETLKRSEFYNDFLLSNGGTHCMAGVVARRGDDVLMLTALREDRREALLPHVARAQQTQERLQVLEAGEVALNELNGGVVLVDAERSVRYLNRAAEDALVHARDGLLLRHGRLAARNNEADAALQRLVAYAAAPDSLLGAPPDVLVHRPSLRRPYHVTASSLRRTVRPYIGGTRPAALVLITDPELHRAIDARALQQGYGLTPAEARLAVALTQGQTLEQAAERLAIRYETARTHLRRILEKTQTSRQADLMMLLSAFDGRLRMQTT